MTAASAPPPAPRPAVARMAGYTPGEQPGPGERLVKLNTNENPWPPSPRVLEAIAALAGESLRRYPPPMADRFRETAARLYGVTPAQVLAGNGSDDILNIVIRAWLDPGDVLAYPVPTYSLYPVLAEIHGARVATVPWRAGWRLPVDALLATGARVIMIANPNAPSGTVVGSDDLRALARGFAGLLLVDEAYAEFADGDALGLLADCPNVLVSRTLSKAYGLAGLRFGYALGHPAVITELTKVKDSYNCDALAIAAACAALEDQDYARAGWAKVRAERGRLANELASRGWDVIPSQANFLFARPPDGDGAAMYRRLREHGVLVRHFGAPDLADRVRITVGTPEENDLLLAGVG